MYDEIAEGIRIHSRCQWYKKGEKLKKFFPNLEKNVESKVKYENLSNRERNI